MNKKIPAEFFLVFKAGSGCSSEELDGIWSGWGSNDPFVELSIYSPLVSSVLDTVEKSMFLRRNSESSRSDMVPRVPGVSTSSSIVMKELVATI